MNVVICPNGLPTLKVADRPTIPKKHRVSSHQEDWLATSNVFAASEKWETGFLSKIPLWWFLWKETVLFSFHLSHWKSSISLHLPSLQCQVPCQCEMLLNNIFVIFFTDHDLEALCFVLTVNGLSILKHLTLVHLDTVHYFKVCLLWYQLKIEATMIILSHRLPSPTKD